MGPNLDSATTSLANYHPTGRHALVLYLIVSHRTTSLNLTAKEGQANRPGRSSGGIEKVIKENALLYNLIYQFSVTFDV